MLVKVLGVFYLNKMNENYNKYRRNIIVVLTIIVSILVACSYNNRKDTNNNTESVDTTDSCGINDYYYEINDVDTTNDGYSKDSVIYLDANGNIIKAPFN